MSRIWVRLWRVVALSGLGFIVSFTVAALLGVVIFGDNPEHGAALALFIILVGGGGTWLLSTWLSALLARRLARPLVAISEATRRVSEGDFSARASVQPASRRLRRKQRRRKGRKPLKRSRGLFAKRSQTLGPVSNRQARRRRTWMRKQRQKRLRGLSETERLLEDFNSMAASLERLERERQATTAAIAHDLRTPLTILRGRLAGARDGLIAPDAAEIALLLAQTELLARMVEDLRTLSLVEAGRLSLRCEDLSASELVERVVAGYVSQAADKGVTLMASVAPQVRLYADADRLQQILVNLLDNALRFAPEGGRVWVSLKTNRRSVSLSVRDDGPGIGEAALGHLFRRFYREDTARTGAGTGLGLAIVHSLVTLHGGSVTAQNHPSGGALFEVTLPHASS